MRLLFPIFTLKDGRGCNFNFAPVSLCTGYPVVVLAATNRLEALDDSLRRPGRLDKELEIGVPSPRERYDIIRKMLKGMLHSLTDDEVRDVWCLPRNMQKIINTTNIIYRMYVRTGCEFSR